MSTITERVLDQYDKKALLEFYMAASALLTDWQDFKEAVDFGDSQATRVRKAWRKVEQGAPARA